MGNPSIRSFAMSDLKSSGFTPSCTYDFDFNGRTIRSQRKSWRTHLEGMKRLILARRLYDTGNIPRYKQYYDDFPMQQIDDMWNDTAAASNMIYAVQTQGKVIERCMLMTTDPGDLVFDPTCGSGTHRLRRRAVGAAVDYLRHFPGGDYPGQTAANDRPIRIL